MSAVEVVAEALETVLREHHETATQFCTCGFVPDEPWPERSFTQQQNPHQRSVAAEAVLVALAAASPQVQAEAIRSRIERVVAVEPGWEVRRIDVRVVGPWREVDQ
jgi:hypothetical protein